MSTVEKNAAKFILGFDLGTTNSVLAYAPLDAEISKWSSCRCRNS